MDVIAHSRTPQRDSFEHHRPYILTATHHFLLAATLTEGPLEWVKPVKDRDEAAPALRFAFAICPTVLMLDLLAD